MSTYRVVITEARGSTSTYTLSRSTYKGVKREVENMRGAHWKAAHLEIYDLHNSTWRATGTRWDWSAP